MATFLRLQQINLLLSLHSSDFDAASKAEAAADHSESLSKQAAPSPINNKTVRKGRDGLAPLLLLIPTIFQHTITEIPLSSKAVVFFCQEAAI